MIENIGNWWNIVVSNINIAGVPLWDLYSNSDKKAVCIIRLYTMDINGDWKFDEIKREFNEDKDELGESVFYVGFEYNIKTFRINDINPVYLNYCFVINNEVCAIGGSSNYPYYYMFIDTDMTPNKNFVNTVSKNSDLYNEEVDALYNQWYKKAGLNHVLNNLQNDHNDIIIGEDRVIQMNDNQNIIIQFDNESELITFRAKREYDGIDLSKKTLYFYGITPGGKNHIKDLVYVNVDEEDSNYIIISWKVTNVFADGSGQMDFAIVAEGENAIDDYLWQTHPARITVHPSILNNEIEFKTISLNDWQKDLLDRLEKLENAYAQGEVKWQTISSLL